MPLEDLRQTFDSRVVPAGSALTLAMPKPRIKGFEVVGEGGHLAVPDGRNAGSGSASLKGVFASVELGGFRLDLPRDTPADGIGLWCKAGFVAIRNGRITGVHGQQDKRHGDGIQVGDQAEIDTLLVENVTILSAYQAIMAHATPGGRGLKTLILRNLNVRDEPDLRKQLSIALLLGDKPTTGKKKAPYTIVLENVWVDWPSKGHCIQFPEGARVLGEINYGVPPGGDFCKAA
ncbi:hypothetical protein [uncultured Methylobacterium sp.]|jgi:hypothetical protein|uniref:hypothetical protein n=1 Tax=uncultured Methylobacterium sp. TaxID=157278 RepID=UPI0026284D8B|nr:hypothetical protein [uncultured Methylobacterium sp.]